MRHLFLTAITGRDNVSVDMHRVLLAVAFMVLCGLEIYRVVMFHEHFDCLQFGSASGGLLLGAGVGMGAKASTDPAPASPSTTGG